MRIPNGAPTVRRFGNFTRVGTMTDTATVQTLTLQPDTNAFASVLGEKQYELTNHLPRETAHRAPRSGFHRGEGNCHSCWLLAKSLTDMHPEKCDSHLSGVLATISDQKKARQDGTTGTVSHWVADVVSYTDYYPFGMMMGERSGRKSEYRYSFQGQETDAEVYGEGNAVSYRYRIHDARIGRFFSVDPLYREYPQWSTYVFSGNQLIHAIELEGLEPNWLNSTIDGVKSFAKNGPFHNMGMDQYYRDNIYGPENQKRIQNSKEFKLIKDATIMTGGLLIVVSTVGGGTPLAAVLVGQTSGMMAFVGGATKFGLDMTGDFETSEKVPTSLTDAIVEPIAIYSLEDTEYEEYIDLITTTLNLTEGILAINPIASSSNSSNTFEVINLTVNIADIAITFEEMLELHRKMSMENQGKDNVINQSQDEDIP